MKKILISEQQYKHIFNIIEGKELLMEMPYSPSDFLIIVDSYARLYYTHLGKLLLFGDSTNNGSDWLNQIINRHITPLLTSKVTNGKSGLQKAIFKGFRTNFFSDDYSDFDTKMREFCSDASEEVTEGALKMYNKRIVPLRDINNALSIGKAIVIEFNNTIFQICGNITDKDEIKSILKDKLQELFTEYGII